MSSKSRLNVEFARNEVGLRQNADAAIQLELDNSQTGSGLNADGTYTADSNSNYLSAAVSLKDADQKLDTQIKTVADDLAALGDGSLTDIQNEIDAIESGAGLGTDGTYTANTSANYIASATSLKSADNALDAAIKVNAVDISNEVTNRTTADAGLQTEIDDTQAGAGLANNGDYVADTGADFINLATSIHNATQRLDTALKSEQTARGVAEANIQSELDNTQAGAGLGTDGLYTANSNSNYLTSATSLKDADNKLDAQIKAVADDLADLGDGSLTDIQNEIDAIETGAGLDTDGSYIANASANYISAATDLADADDILDTAINNNATAITNEVSDRTTAIGVEAAARADQDDAIELGAGLETNGTYAANNSTNYLGTATSLKNADEKLDVQVKANETAIATETSDRVSAIDTVNTNLNSEVTNRTNADTALQTEIDAIETGAGLNSNGTYSANSSANYIAAATDLKDADNKLDAQVKTNTDNIATLSGDTGTAISDLQDELDDTQTGAGLGIDGAYTANASANYITTATSLKSADNLLDSAIKTEETARTNADSAIQTEIDDTQAGAGLDVDGGYTADSGTNYITTATSLKNADALLDAQIKSNADKDTAQDLVIDSKLPKAGGTMSGAINMDNNAITGLPSPTNASDAANKAYVDGNLAGLSWKNACKAAGTSNLDLDGPETLDGVTCAAGDRVLVMNQTDASENGIYIVNASAWTRADDFDSLTPIDEVNGAAVYVEEGNTYSHNGYTVTSTVNTLDTDPVIFTQFNGASGVTAGTGLVKTGNTLDVNLGAGIGELPSDEIGVEVYPAGGLFNTIDGSSVSTDAAAQLSVKLDSNTLTLSSNGLKVTDSVITDISTNATAIATETTNRTNADTAIQTELDATQTGAGLGTDGSYTANAGSNYITTATSLQDADNKLDTQIKTNADDISTLSSNTGTAVGDLQTELDATQTGAGLGTDGSYTADTNSNYITTATSLQDADNKLDAKLKLVSDVADAAEPDLGVGNGEDYVLMTATDGTRSWVPFNQTQVGRIHEVFTATANQSVFNVNYDANIVDVWLNGFKLINGSDFTATNGTSITVSPALSAGDILEVTSYEQYTYGAVPQLDANGDLYINGDVHADAFYTDSLRELKTNIVKSEISALQMINETEIVEFNYKDNLEGDTRIGFIADDTDPMMSGSKQNQFDMANTIGVLLKAVQELTAEVVSLRAKIGE